jgi:hypothetical protein
VSDLILPPGYTRNAMSDAMALKRANDQVVDEGNFEPYYDEWPKIQAAGNKLNRIFAFSGEEPWTERQFETTAANLFGEAGFTIMVEWLQAMDTETGEELPYKAPNIRFTGRVDKESERDHDRIRDNIVKGLGPDKQAGYIREDGSKHEDPIRTVIT